MRREYPEMPLVGVGAVIVHEQRVLLIRRATEPMKGRWSIPGGLVELGESLLDAVRRECLEETGVQVEPIQLVELVDRVHREQTRVRYHYVIADYLCRVTGGQPVAGSDASEVCWAERRQWLSAVQPLDPALDPDERNLDAFVLNLDSFTARVVEAGWQMACTAQSSSRPDNGKKRGQKSGLERAK